MASLKKFSSGFKKVWHDPVGAAVIAAGVVALFAGLPVYFLGWLPIIKEWLLADATLPNWCLSLLVTTAILYARSISLRVFSSSKSSITRLLNNALNDAYPITSLLREARIIAQGKKDSDFVKWIDQELKGEYPSLVAKDLPSYRRIYGDLRALDPYQGWQPVRYANTEMREMLSYAPTGQDIGSIEKIVKSNTGKPFGFIHSPSQKQILMDAVEGCADVELIVNRSSLEGILNAVRRKVYEWASQKEESDINYGQDKGR